MITPQEVGQRIKDLLAGWDGFDEEMRRVSLIQMRNLRPSDKILRIDADSLLYYTAYAANFKDGEAIEGGTFVGSKQRVTFKDYKQHLDDLVADIVLACELASFRNELPRFNDYELVFTPSTNFRYDIFPDYKKSRANKPQSNTLKRLKKYAKKHLGIVPEGIEADDYVYYWASKGHPVASGDKDVVYSVPAAYYYHTHHQKVVQNTKEEATRFMLLQSLMGDSSDDIPGLIGLGKKTAEKLLGDALTFDRVIEIYENKNTELKSKADNTRVRKIFENKTYTKEDAILTRRLVGLDQWHPRRGVRLWQ